MFVMPHMGSKGFSSSLSCFPALGMLLVVLKEHWSRIGIGEEARKLLTWVPGSVSLTRCEVPGEALYHLLSLIHLSSPRLTLFPELTRTFILLAFAHVILASLAPT